MKVKNHSRGDSRSTATGYSSEEAEVAAVSLDENKEVKSLQSKAKSSRSSRRHHKYRHHDDADDEYYQSASNFYAHSVVVETIYRRPQVFADLHQYDEEAEIDCVPTAVGFHSMDSTEEVVAARSTGKRYEMDEIPVVTEGADRDPSFKSTSQSQVSRSNTAATKETREPGQEELEAEEQDQFTLDDDFRYGHLREEKGLPAVDVILRTNYSDDSESCPPIWKTESQEEPRDRDWMIAEAKRIRELNSVTVPRKILREYETSQIIRQPFVEPSSHRSGAKWSRALRKLVGGRVSDTTTTSARNNNNNITDSSNNDTLPKSSTLQSFATSSVTHGGNDAESKVSRTSSKKSKGNASARSNKGEPNSSASLKNYERDEKQEEEQVYDDTSKGGSRLTKASSRYHQVQYSTSNKDAMTKSSKDGTMVKSVSSKKSRVTNTNDPPPQQEEDEEEVVQEEVVEERRDDDRNVSSKATTQSESIFSLEESKREGSSTTANASRAPVEATITATQNNNNNNNNSNDDLVAASRSQDDEGDSIPDEDISLQETATTQGGFGLTDWIINGFDNLANIGLNQPMFGFLDWNGEEKVIEKLEAATTQKDTTAGNGRSFNPSGKRLPPKTNMTKRLLSKEEIKARLIEGHARRQQESQANERSRGRRTNRDPDGVPASSPRGSGRNGKSPISPRRKARSVTPTGSESVEVRTLALDDGDKQQSQSHSRTKKSLTDSTQQKRQPVANQEGLTVRLPTRGSGRGGSKDEDDTSTSLLGLEKKENEKGASKKPREQSKNKKTLFGPFRLQNKKQQPKP